MSELTVNLGKWAEILDSGEYYQCRESFADGKGGVCVLGAGYLAFGVSYDDIASCRYGARSIDATATLAVMSIAPRVAQRTRAICSGRSEHLVGLNDSGVDFPTFARAIRTVARQLEEEDYGAPIVASARTRAQEASHV